MIPRSSSPKSSNGQEDTDDVVQGSSRPFVSVRKPTDLERGPPPPFVPRPRALQIDAKRVALEEEEEVDSLSPLPSRPAKRLDPSIQHGPVAQEIQGILVPERKYHLGAYADVWRGKWTPPGGQEISVAIKYLRCVRMSMQMSILPELQADRVNKRLRREVYAWEKLSHPHITPLLGFRSGDEPLLLSPFYENGNLGQYLRKNPDAPRLSLVVHAAKGLLYLHTLDPIVVHGDIKPDNVLVNDNNEASLCDFGLARMIQEMKTGLTTSGQGQGGKGFIAPELLDCEEGEKKTTESDVYAFGGLILHALSGSAPFYHKSVSQTIADVCFGRPVPKEKHSAISPNATIWALMQRCWQLKPKNRPNMQEIYSALLVEEQYYATTGRLALEGDS
ncbi:hypothetical protein FRB94_013740 [Tulasnella sp. JGI-2019a]|nr:hypothetical protein FRB94_013740 [Tulasnella sp. JGI-2019a]KAG9009183.1 hypothetical protein FRB93_005679 [Tulasnella sp. JGI-2019a]KAG9038185.1 hypothetical protein FRB95_002625 [Tulasnella sp. JGI-2019a]